MSNYLIDRVSRQGGNPVRKRALAAKFNAVREKNGGLRTAVDMSQGISTTQGGPCDLFPPPPKLRRGGIIQKVQILVLNELIMST